MILRRFSESLKQQNWTAIAIEFVLLVLGVFLGIQVSNWNATQQEHALEAEYIARLQRDFRAIDARVASNVSIWQEKAKAPVRLLADIASFQQRGTWPRGKATILRDLEGTMDGRIPAPRAATYVELLSAGKLGLIRDTRLRDALLEYDAQTGFTMKAYDVLVLRTDPFMATIVAHLEYDRNRFSGPSPDDRRRAGSVEAFSDVDLEQLAADPGMKVALNMHAMASENQLRVALFQQGKARAVTTLLQPDARHVEGKQP